MYFLQGGNEPPEDYFLAGRDIGLVLLSPVLPCSFRTHLHGALFIGFCRAPELRPAWRSGIFEWLACLILLVLGWVFVAFLPAPFQRIHQRAGIPRAPVQS